VRTFNGSSSSIWSLASVQKHLFLSGSEGKTLKLWSILDGTCLSSILSPDDKGGVMSILSMKEEEEEEINENTNTAALTPTTTICSASYDKSFKVWKLIPQPESC